MQAVAEFAKQQRLDTWKRNMLKGGREATKWLNNHANVVSPSLLYDSGGRRVSTYGPNDSLEQLKGFWDSIRYRYSNVALDFALQQWQREGRRSQLDSFNINAQDLWMSARKSSGSSAGPDGWTGNEVAAWPLRAWQVYAKLLARWQARRQWPEAWKHVRQVHLPKEMSAEDGGAVHFSNMRPICVQSILWRVVASSITRHANVTRWLQQVLPHEAHGGIPGRGIDTAVSSLEEAFQKRSSILVTMDYSKCFDMVAPRLALKTLEAAGFPDVWFAMLSHVWLDQHRWLQLGQNFLPQALQLSQKVSPRVTPSRL